MAAKLGRGPDGHVKGGPRIKMSRVAAAADRIDRIHSFETLPARVNIMKGCALSSEYVHLG